MLNSCMVDFGVHLIYIYLYLDFKVSLRSPKITAELIALLCIYEIKKLMYVFEIIIPS